MLFFLSLLLLWVSASAFTQETPLPVPVASSQALPQSSELPPVPESPKAEAIQIGPSKTLLERSLMEVQAWTAWYKKDRDYHGQVIAWFEKVTQSWNSLKSSYEKQEQAYQALLQEKDLEIASLNERLKRNGYLYGGGGFLTGFGLGYLAGHVTK